MTASAIVAVPLAFFHLPGFYVETGSIQGAVREFIPATAEDQFLILNGFVIVGAILIIILTRDRLSYRPGRGRH